VIDLKQCSTIDSHRQSAFRTWFLFGFMAILLSICIVGATQFANLQDIFRAMHT
jgi:hypothetical protein